MRKSSSSSISSKLHGYPAALEHTLVRRCLVVYVIICRKFLSSPLWLILSKIADDVPENDAPLVVLLSSSIHRSRVARAPAAAAAVAGPLLHQFACVSPSFSRSVAVYTTPVDGYTWNRVKWSARDSTNPCLTVSINGRAIVTLRAAFRTLRHRIPALNNSFVASSYVNCRRPL